MFSYPEKMLAWRYMRSKRREGFISIITLFSIVGIMLGVATLILVTSLMNGIRDEMLSNFIGVDGHISVYGYERGITGADTLRDELLQIDGVSAVAQRVEGQVMASSPHRALGAKVVGLSFEDFKQKPALMAAVEDGTLTDFSDGGGLIIGKRLAENLGVSVGDSITLISPRGRATIAGFVPRMKAYPIRATFNLGMHMLDGNMMFMPYGDASIYFQLPKNAGGSASSLSVDITESDNVKQVSEAIDQATMGNYRIYNVETSNQGIMTALNIQRDVMVVILALIVLVAAFNIISSLIMLVQGKSGDIAILRTMGATRGMVMNVFVLSGMVIGAVGTVLGLLLGLLAASNIETLRKGLEAIMGQELLVGDIYFLSTLPTKTNPTEVLSIVLLSLGLSFASTLYPAYKAAGQEPAEALRYA